MSEDNKSGSPAEGGSAPAGAPEGTTAPTGAPQGGAAPAAAAQGIVETLKTNPKARYALIGAVAALIVWILLPSGGSVKQAPVAAVSAGAAVTLENPNGGLSHLTTVPGLVSASDAEEDKEQSVCLAKAGTKATIEEEQVVGMLPFVKVKVLDGECQGKSGWTSKVNVKAG
jgi:hypothetical protein